MKKGDKKIGLIVAVLGVLIVASLILFLKPIQNSEEYIIDESDFVVSNSLVGNIEKSDLSQSEIDGLVLMREEEKLARDVYLTLHEQWGQAIFSNIAESEQTHTNSVKFLLDRYEIEDPVKDNNIGVFTSDEMASLYNDLVSIGLESQLNAFIVGATIEDLDIKDLEDLISGTDNEDIRIVYKNLQKGSRNHLRAYVNQIKRNGGTYSPQYISQETYENIISSNQERGIV